MQRIRMSLPYYHQSGWNAEVVTVDDQYADLVKDELLLESVPASTKVHKVKALPKNITSKLGLGSIALRSIYFFRKKVNVLLSKGHYDLIYFSTTQFPVCILGAYWKRKFGIPYVIDLQDPWHSEYYQDKPKSQRPPKYWISYRLNKFLEPLALKQVDGLISVSKGYLTALEKRYPRLAGIASSVITFGAFNTDLDIALKHKDKFEPLLDPAFKNVVYIGRGGADMLPAISLALNALKNGIERNINLKSIKLYFIGTSYAANGHGTETIKPFAENMGLGDQVIEITDRIGFYHALTVLASADALFIPGSDDLNYTASKIYPYLSTRKPVLAIFSSTSSGLTILKEYGAVHAFDFQQQNMERITDFFEMVLQQVPGPVAYDAHAIERYSARTMAQQQCLLFNKVLDAKN
ncbi:hypothetical protein [Mucilaginibacter phenanthrenivorans]|uniref:hypothetical protein n=1 Tax=Mucilaginibacter phenanthrenivorans TaxID=1234842 RepID=UPI0021583084|nr:hypothetical protein [Mucilaginibacter phenanthrenivorans]